MYEAGDSYTVSQATTITANVGLPTVGEMFSGNDIDLNRSNKPFVDVNTTENPTAAIIYWMMNFGADNFFFYNNEYGALYADDPVYNFANSSDGGVRPTIYLKSGASALTFFGGKGTAQEPYELQ